MTRALLAYLALYTTTYAAFGVASPFLPSFLTERGLSASQVGLLLATGTAVRLLSAPVAAQIADRFQHPRAVLLVVLAASAGVALLYLPSHSFLVLVGVSLAHATTLAPVTVTADALALGQRRAFDYGWVRGAGSAAFVAGTFLSGAVLDRFGTASFLPLNAGWLLLAACCVFFLPAPPEAKAAREAGHAGDVRVLLRNPVFLRTVLIAALILSSHAMHDAFAVIRWRAAGFSNSLISVLWSEAVVAEVVMFTLLGPWLLKRLNRATCIAAAAGFGILRWSVVSATVQPVLIGAVEPLHGVTFALLHLACMRVFADIVPAGLATSAQAIYHVGASAAASALVTLLSGPLYDRYGGGAFLAMNGLCLVALPFAWHLRGALASAAPPVRGAA